jgi:hypothetical protein
VLRTGHAAHTGPRGLYTWRCVAVRARGTLSIDPGASTETALFPKQRAPVGGDVTEYNDAARGLYAVLKHCVLDCWYMTLDASAALSAYAYVLLMALCVVAAHT